MEMKRVDSSHHLCCAVLPMKTNECLLPVVKRSWLSARGLDSDNEGKAAGGCEAGGTVVAAGEDWVRTSGWWAKIRAGTLVGSSWTPDLRITCLCGSQHRGETKKKFKIFFFVVVVD